VFTADEMRRIPLFGALTEAQLQRLARKAADVHLEAGEWLIREGEPSWFYLLVEGHLKVTKDVFGSQQELVEYEYAVGDFFGELPLLLGTTSMVSLRADMPTRIARLDTQQFQHLMRGSKAISTAVLKKMDERVQRVREYGARIPASRVVIVGTEYDTDCRDVRSFLVANRIFYEWVDRGREPERVPACVPSDVGGPAVVVDGGTCIHPPTVRAVAQALRLQTEPGSDAYDVVVVGAGPAGMAAGVYGASEGLKVLLVERSAPGGQAGTSSRIENYLGFPESITGEELTARALRQALRFGAEIAMTRTIEALESRDEGYALRLDGGRHVLARAVLLATGVDWRRLEIAGAQRLLGRGVLYGASRTEAIAVNGKRVFIIGGGNSAGQAAVFFSNYAAEVKLVVRGPGLKQSMSQYLIGQMAAKGNIELLPFTEVIAAEGADALERIVTRTHPPGQLPTQLTSAADALFVMIGADAITGWLPDALERDEKGFIRTGRDLMTWTLSRDAFPLETSLPGVFCAGDVRHGSIKRVSSGVGEGSMAVAFIHQYLALQENIPVALGT
jgi:thioredoxin reductase (NADPH)